MPSEGLFLNRAVVFVGAVLYWGGVLVQARRVRRRIGRSPNTRPRGTKEKLLWAGWSVVIIVWMALPLVTGTEQHLPWLRVFPVLLHPTALALGILLTLLGYAGTLWCYAAMGDAWRMGTNNQEQTTLVTCGPYRWVRNPIYLFQMAMLAGVILVLPTALSMLNFFIHAACVLVKVADEESYLGAVHGKKYGEYGERTGRFFPRFYKQRTKAK